MPTIVAPNIHSLLLYEELTKIAIPSYAVRLIDPDSGVTASTGPIEGNFFVSFVSSTIKNHL